MHFRIPPTLITVIIVRMYNCSYNYEGGYLRNPLRGGVFDSTGCLFLSTERILMFLDVLERGDHARSFKNMFMHFF